MPDIVAELIKAFVDLAVSAWKEKDPAKMERVTDVLPTDHPLRTELTAEIEREKTRRALEGQG